MTMLVMTMSTTFIEKQLAKMAWVITKLTKIFDEKDLKIVSFMNKVETQA